MIFYDLDYIETLSVTSNIVGAESASTNANTIAEYGFGYADANAVASGQQSSTITKTYTKVYVGPYYAITQAYATADAYARTDNSYYTSTYDSIALFISDQI